MTIYSLATVRALALHTQGLTCRNDAEPSPTPDALEAMVEQIGCIQIDTLQVVHRSQYLTLWSRVGVYNPSDLDRLLDDPRDRRLFEGWQHAACIIPMGEYRYQMPHQRFLRTHPAGMTEKWLNEPGNRELLKSMLKRVRKQGAVRASDFESDGQKRSGWWDWKPAKNALEHLYAWGDLMIAGRVNFQRVYDLTERLLPDWVDTSEPSAEERDRFWIERGARALGICTPQQTADYTWMKASRARPHIEQLTHEGVLVPVRARLVDGKIHKLVVHCQNLPLLEQAADREIRPARTTFLSPFDNMFWARGRDEKFWGFRQRLEAYTP
ncbi:MAG TPA: crosslink repair DNA glycosylase YcaQ family protein, partial [Anaerolineales bacterium]